MTQEWKISEEEERLVSKDIVKLKERIIKKLMARKVYGYCIKYPYRKPTQVDEEKILR